MKYTVNVSKINIVAVDVTKHSIKQLFQLIGEESGSSPKGRLGHGSQIQRKPCCQTAITSMPDGLQSIISRSTVIFIM